MISAEILTEHSQIIANLIDDDDCVKVTTLFADLDISNISVDDFICTSTILQNCNDCEWAQCAKNNVMEYWRSSRYKAISDIITHTTRIKNAMDTTTHTCTCAKIDDVCDACHNYGNDATNINNHEFPTTVKNNDEIASLINKYTDTHTNTSWEHIRNNYLNHIGIANILTTCDKLKIMPLIRSVAALNIQLPSTMTTSLINFEQSECDAYKYNLGYRFVSDSTLTYFDSFLPKRTLKNMVNSQRTAIKNGLRVTKIVNVDIELTEFILEESSYANLKAIQAPYGNKEELYRTLLSHNYKSLTYLDIRISDIEAYNALANIYTLQELHCNGLSPDRLNNNNKMIALPNSLRVIHASDIIWDDPFYYSSIICDACLHNCTFIEKMICDHNGGITTCDPFALSLRVLSATGKCGITDDSLKNCINIKKLDCSHNTRITTCKPFANTLRVLAAAASSITDDGIKKCIHIEELDCRSNNKISSCIPFARSLRILLANGDKNMSDAGLANCKNIEEFYCCNTDKITTCKPFHKSLRKLFANQSKITNDGIALCTNINTISCDAQIVMNNTALLAKSLTTLYVTDTDINTDALLAMNNKIQINNPDHMWEYWALVNINYCERFCGFNKHFDD